MTLCIRHDTPQIRHDTPVRTWTVHPTWHWSETGLKPVRCGYSHPVPVSTDCNKRSNRARPSRRHRKSTSPASVHTHSATRIATRRTRDGSRRKHHATSPMGPFLPWSWSTLALWTPGKQPPADASSQVDHEQTVSATMRSRRKKNWRPPTTENTLQNADFSPSD